VHLASCVVIGDSRQLHRYRTSNSPNATLQQQLSNPEGHWSCARRLLHLHTFTPNSISPGIPEIVCAETEGARESSTCFVEAVTPVNSSYL
jgi:hypothetical protein